MLADAGKAAMGAAAALALAAAPASAISFDELQG
jgi:hypothetical protein